jgi:hypothetical protein
MNNSSATTIPCAGCNCYLGDVMQSQSNNS